MRVLIDNQNLQAIRGFFKDNIGFEIFEIRVRLHGTLNFHAELFELAIVLLAHLGHRGVLAACAVRSAFFAGFAELNSRICSRWVFVITLFGTEHFFLGIGCRGDIADFPLGRGGIINFAKFGTACHDAAV